MGGNAYAETKEVPGDEVIAVIIDGIGDAVPGDESHDLAGNVLEELKKAGFKIIK